MEILFKEMSNESETAGLLVNTEPGGLQVSASREAGLEPSSGFFRKSTGML